MEVFQECKIYTSIRFPYEECNEGIVLCNVLEDLLFCFVFLHSLTSCLCLSIVTDVAMNPFVKDFQRNNALYLLTEI